MQCGRPRSLSQQNVNCPTAAIASPGRRVSHNVAAHPAGAEPPLNVFLQNGLVLLRVPAAAVNNANAGEAGSQRFEQEFFKYKAGFLLVQAMQVQMSLNRKSARTQIIEIEPSVRMHCP